MGQECLSPSGLSVWPWLKTHQWVWQEGCAGLCWALQVCGFTLRYSTNEKMDYLQDHCFSPLNDHVWTFYDLSLHHSVLYTAVSSIGRIPSFLEVQVTTGLLFSCSQLPSSPSARTRDGGLVSLRLAAKKASVPGQPVPPAETILERLRETSMLMVSDWWGSQRWTLGHAGKEENREEEKSFSFPPAAAECTAQVSPVSNGWGG